MMPVLASIVDQIVELSVPEVWSLFFDPALRAVNRRIEVTQTLNTCQRIGAVILRCSNVLTRVLVRKSNECPLSG